MFRTAFLATVLSAVLVSVFAQTEPQDLIGQLHKLTLLTDNKQYREAIEGYRLLAVQPGTPGWLKAACEYETAELYGALEETDRAIAALGGAVRLGFDDCIGPRASKSLRTVLKNPKATEILEGILIAEADYRELAWLIAEAQRAGHDGRIMVIENTNRLDQEATVVPQVQLPTRSTASAGVLYWRQLLLLVQRMQREFVMKADLMRIRHATNMAIIRGASASAAIESARRARLAAESRRVEILKRAFVPGVSQPDRPRPCSEWSLESSPPPVR